QVVAGGIGVKLVDAAAVELGEVRGLVPEDLEGIGETALLEPGEVAELAVELAGDPVVAVRARPRQARDDGDVHCLHPAVLGADRELVQIGEGRLFRNLRVDVVGPLHEQEDVAAALEDTVDPGERSGGVLARQAGVDDGGGEATGVQERLQAWCVAAEAVGVLLVADAVGDAVAEADVALRLCRGCLGKQAGKPESQGETRAEGSHRLDAPHGLPPSAVQAADRWAPAAGQRKTAEVEPEVFETIGRVLCAAGTEACRMAIPAESMSTTSQPCGMAVR